MKDFTISIYKNLLQSLKDQHYYFQTFREFIEKPVSKVIILRHDVDKLPENSLIFAQIQHKLGIKGSYFFRIVPQSFDEKIIRQIAELRHEIGYHYEDVSLVANRRWAEGGRRKGFNEKEIVDEALESFAGNLERLRRLVPVKTICMHGSPWSKYDNRLLWKYYDYRDFGIIGEPYFDLDFTEVLYLTDTGRRWDGERVSVRDRVMDSKQYSVGSRQDGVSSKEYVVGSKQFGDGNEITGEVEPETRNQQPVPSTQYLNLKYRFHSTFDIIRAAEKGELPDKIMFTFHPQRWTDGTLPWVKELVWQRVKNVGKRVLVKFRD